MYYECHSNCAIIHVCIIEPSCIVPRTASVIFHYEEYRCADMARFICYHQNTDNHCKIQHFWGVLICCFFHTDSRAKCQTSVNI